MAESKWGESGTIMIRGQLAVEYGGEDVLSESTRTFLDGALAARGWRWSTQAVLGSDGLLVTGGPKGWVIEVRIKSIT